MTTRRPRVPLRAAWVVAALFLVPSAAQPPDLGAVGQAADQVAGTVVPPAMRGAANATGQDLAREDVRLRLDLNFTKGTVDVLGMIVGAGQAEIQCSIRLVLEMRVLRSDRVRAAIEGDNPYNVTADNATVLANVYLTAEAFRATLTAEAIAAFQRHQERALRDYLQRTVPELDVLSLDVTWSNVSPATTVRDLSLTEPPIVATVDATVQYLHTESILGLLQSYLARRDDAPDPKKEYARRLKDENGQPLHARDFFAAAAYTQLLNLSMQPGWLLNVSIHLPEGYAFTYFNENVELVGDRTAIFSVDATEAQGPVQEALLASITHKRAVALSLLAMTLALGLLLALPGRLAYGRWRVLALARADPAPATPTGAGAQPADVSVPTAPVPRGPAADGSPVSEPGNGGRGAPPRPGKP